MKRTGNPISRIVNFWVDSILRGYITKIVVDTIKSYSETAREFFQGLRGRYLKSSKLWIKMLVCEKGILGMEPNE